MKRKGLGKGKGSGYYNIIPTYDSYVHSLSARGIKSYLPKKLKAMGNLTSYVIDSEYSVVVWAEDTRTGFRHLAKLMKNGVEIDTAKAVYYNRTWERYNFQTVINSVIRKHFDEKKAEEKIKLLEKKAGLYRMDAKGKVPFDLRDTRMFNFTDIVKKVGDEVVVRTEDGLEWTGSIVKEFPKTKEIEVYLYAKGKKNPVNKDNLVNYIMDYEGGDPTVEDVVNLFSYLVETGQAWTLQGMYGRQAQRLIEAGILDKKGKINWKKVDKPEEEYYGLNAKGNGLEYARGLHKLKEWNKRNRDIYQEGLDDLEKGVPKKVVGERMIKKLEENRLQAKRDLLADLSKKGVKINKDLIRVMKRRLNDNKITQSMIFLDGKKSYIVAKDLEKQGFDYLMNLWKTPLGKERLNNPFGFREETILKDFDHFELREFRDTATSFAQDRGIHYYNPIWTVVSKSGDEFDYYWTGDGINITG